MRAAPFTPTARGEWLALAASDMMFCLTNHVLLLHQLTPLQLDALPTAARQMAVASVPPGLALTLAARHEVQCLVPPAFQLCPAPCSSHDPCSTLIVTEECLLHPSRNPHYGKAGIEAVLKVCLCLRVTVRGLCCAHSSRGPAGCSAHAVFASVHYPSLSYPTGVPGPGEDHLAVEGRGRRRLRGQRWVALVPMPCLPALMMHVTALVAESKLSVRMLLPPARLLPPRLHSRPACACCRSAHAARPGQLMGLPCPAIPPHTTGHVDNFCCFIAPGVVALAWPDNENDWNDPQVGTKRHTTQPLGASSAALLCEAPTGSQQALLARHDNVLLPQPATSPLI